MENLTRPRLVKSLLTIAFVAFQMGCTEVKFKDGAIETQTVQSIKPETPEYPPEIITPPPPEPPVVTPAPEPPPAVTPAPTPTPEPPPIVTPAPTPEPPVVTPPPPVVTPPPPVVTPPPPVVTPPPTPVPPPVCTPEVIHIPTKVLFIVDKSSSNQGFWFTNIFGSTYSPGTDDNKVMRAGVISTFLEHHQSNANFSWGFITFSGETAKNLIPGLPKNQIFTKDPTKMAGAIHEFQRKSDQGDTPYLAALSLAYKGLAADPDLKTADKINYIVVFLSDGVPTDYAADISGQKKLMADLGKLVKLSPKISFNTVYYGSKNDIASHRLKQMSVLGKGQFLDTNLNPNGKDFQIDDIIKIPNSCD